MTWLTDFLKSAGDFLRPAVDFLSSLPFGWVDFVTILVICLGIVRGRKRGLSEEILDVTKWLIIVALAAFLYRPLGDFLNIHSVLSPLSYYLIAYMIIISGVWLTFSYIKKRFGEKLSESDVFGRAEFYGGMVAGSIRWFCIYFVLLSMLHAPYYSDAERAQRKKEVEYNWGSDFFPSMVKIQDSVYKSSFTGQGAEAYIEFLLMEPVSGDTKPLRHENSLAKRRERAVDEAYGQK